MNKSIVFVLGMLVLTSFATAASGSMWTTDINCGGAQDSNHYAIGEDVWVRASGFDSYEVVDWSITGLPGGASCDPKIVVASDEDFVVDENGYACFYAYTVQQGDCGEYKVDFANKHDNYRVDVEVPEFGVIAGGLALIGALGVFMYRRN